MSNIDACEGNMTDYKIYPCIERLECDLSFKGSGNLFSILFSMALHVLRGIMLRHAAGREGQEAVGQKDRESHQVQEG